MRSRQCSAVADQVLRFPEHVRVEWQPDSVVVLGEDGLRTVSGEAAVEVCALVDGARTRGDIEEAVAGRVTPADVAAVLDGLVGAGILVPGGASGGPSTVEFHSAAVGRPVGTGALPVVALYGLVEPQTANAVRDALRYCTAGVVDLRAGAAPERDVDVAVVVVDDHLDPRLEALDLELRMSGTPWLPVRPAGMRQWIGPFFGTTEDGPCWQCIAARMRTHRRAEEEVSRRLGAALPMSRPLPSRPATIGIAAQAVALEIDSWSHGVDRPDRRAVLVQDSRTMTWEHHGARRRPQCPACGDPEIVARAARTPVRLDPSPEVDLSDDPGLLRHLHLVGAPLGVVPSLTTMPGPVPGSVLGRSGATLASRASSLAGLRVRRHHGNGGVGATEEQARASALGEALERWSGQFHGDELRVRTRRVDLGSSAVDPDDCVLLDARQYSDAQGWNAGHGPFNWIGPAPDDALTDWSPLWSLRDGERRWLPTAMLYYGAPGPAWARADSNGCAAGPTRDEAIRRGLLELVERDAVAIWWYNRARLPAVPVADDVRAAHDTLGRDVWALDLTTDLGLPVVAAISARRRAGGADDRVMLGFAADTDRDRALRRALDELAATTVLATGDGAVGDDPDLRVWVEQVDTSAEPWLVPCRDAAASAVRPPGSGARGVADRLVAHGLDPLVLDQTRPDVGLPVVRVVVPTLRPMWARFAPGRLFDVPVALGRQITPTPYDGLNPRPVFL